MFVDPNGTTHTELDHIKEFRDRWSYARPALIALSENKGRWFNVPDSNPVERYWLPEGKDGSEYLILSDHNRSPVTVNIDRIGTNNRMIDASMRSYYVADKMTLTFSWDTLPSRAFAVLGGYEVWNLSRDNQQRITSDGGAGGSEMLDWYNRHKGAMWIFLSYDSAFGNKDPSSDRVIFTGYSKVFEAQITSFEHEITKRTPPLTISRTGRPYQFDFWNVSMTLEEV